jgi:hypothetical protein
VAKTELAAHNPAIDQAGQPNIGEQPIHAAVGLSQQCERLFARVRGKDIEALTPCYASNQFVQVGIIFDEQNPRTRLSPGLH